MKVEKDPETKKVVCTGKVNDEHIKQVKFAEDVFVDN